MRFRSRAAYKIAVGYAAFFAWSTIIFGIAVYLAVNAEMALQRDRAVSTELRRLQHEFHKEEVRGGLKSRKRRNSADHFSYAIFNKDGQRIAGNLDIVMPDRTGFGGLSELGGAQGGTVRVGVVDPPTGGRLVVAYEAVDSDQLNTTILKYFSLAFILLMTVNIIAGWMVARFLRNRLRPICATAEAIVMGDLNLRVPIGHCGDEFDAAGRAFNLMLDRVAGLMENLRQVSSDIAHDLRKPLIRLLNEADRLGQGKGAEERVLEIGDELLALFAGILRIAEVEGGGLERSFERVDLSSLMIEVSESYAPALADAGNSIEWTIEPEVLVMGNRELLAQLAANLLDNARIHTPPGTAIRLALSIDSSHAKLSVEDNGAGVEEADRAKLLQRFFRADASRRTPGNGLGLSLVAAATHAHGGSVVIEDAGPGLRIVVKLPRLEQ